MTLEEYIESHSDRGADYLAKIERETWLRQKNPRMVSGHLQGRVLSMISKMIEPDRILELGSFIGYSALCLAEGLSEKGRLDTIELDDELEDVILSNFARSTYAEKIRLHIGDAREVLPKLKDEYDLVFLDADKNFYTEHYEMVLPMVRSGGFILADNTLWNGKVLEDLISEKDKQTNEIFHFNEMLLNDTRVEQVILPLRDGLTLIRKI